MSRVFTSSNLALFQKSLDMPDLEQEECMAERVCKKTSWVSAWADFNCFTPRGNDLIHCLREFRGREWLKILQHKPT